MNRASSFSSDRLLVEKVLSGNTKTFSIIIANTERLVAQIVRKMILNDEEQKDLAQDIYLKAFQNLSTFRFQSKLSTWIGRIAYHTCCNHLEKKRIPLSAIDAIDEYKQPGTDNIEKDIFSKELSAIVKNEINKLPPLYKTLITLYHVEGLHNDEISQITDLPEGTIKSYLYRARNMLKKSIERNYKNEAL